MLLLIRDTALFGIVELSSKIWPGVHAEGRGRGSTESHLKILPLPTCNQKPYITFYIAFPFLLSYFYNIV